MKSNKNSVVAIFESHERAEDGIRKHQKSGCDRKKLSSIGKDYHAEQDVVGYYNTGDRMNGISTGWRASFTKKLLLASSQWKWAFPFALGAMVALGFGPDARADITLNISNAVGAAMSFDGTGNGATVDFTTNALGEGFQVTESSNYPNDPSAGLYGTVGGIFSYLKSAIVGDEAPLTTTDGSFSITDQNNQVLTAQIVGVNILSMGTIGGIDAFGSVNIGEVTYSGSNPELMALAHNADTTNQAVISFSFQLVPGQTLSQLASDGEQSTSWSATIIAPGTENGQSVPEPGTLALGCIALGTIGVGMGWSRGRKGA